MLTYKSLEIVNGGSKDQSNEKSNDITHKHIENMQKKIRSHRAALNFDKGFIVASLKSRKDFDLKEEVEIAVSHGSGGIDIPAKMARLTKSFLQE